MTLEDIIPTPEGTSTPALIVWSVAIIITVLLLGRRQDKTTDKASSALLTEMKAVYSGMVADLQTQSTSQQQQINTLREDHRKEISKLQKQLHDVQIVIATDVADIIDWSDAGAHPEHWPGISDALRRIVELAKQSRSE